MTARMVRLADKDGIAPLLRGRFFWYDDGTKHPAQHLKGHFHLWQESMSVVAVAASHVGSLPPDVEAAAFYLAATRAYGEELPLSAQTLYRAGVRFNRSLSAIKRQVRDWGGDIGMDPLFVPDLGTLREILSETLVEQADRLEQLTRLWQDALSAANSLTQEENAYFSLLS